MTIRVACGDDAEAIQAIYAPIVERTAISLELDVPSVAVIRERIDTTLARFPWLVSTDDAGHVDGYVYAGSHRTRAGYRWSVDVSVYVRDDARGGGVGTGLYRRLLDELVALGYHQAFAGIALPNAASVALHEAVGFAFVGRYRDVGYKLGAWHDVGWWQRSLRASDVPTEPRAFRAG